MAVMSVRRVCVAVVAAVCTLNLLVGSVHAHVDAGDAFQSGIRTTARRLLLTPPGECDALGQCPGGYCCDRFGYCGVCGRSAAEVVGTAHAILPIGSHHLQPTGTDSKADGPPEAADAAQQQAAGTSVPDAAAADSSSESGTGRHLLQSPPGPREGLCSASGGCPAGYCCSRFGHCGGGPDYCGGRSAAEVGTAHAILPIGSHHLQPTGTDSKADAPPDPAAAAAAGATLPDTKP